MDQKILDYIKSQKEKGFHEHQIRAALIHAGYPEHVVDENLHFSKPGHKILYISIAIIVISLAAAGIIMKLPKDPSADDLYYAGNYNAAKVEYQKLVEKEPDNPDNLYNLAITLVELKEYEQAQETMNRVPDSFRFKDILFGRLYYRIGDYTHANISFTDSKLSHPDMYASYAGLALINYKLKKYDKAIDNLKEGINMTDEDCLSIYLLGINSEQNNQTHDYFRQAEERNCALRKEFNS